jgi:hypothetical protein
MQVSTCPTGRTRRDFIAVLSNTVRVNNWNVNRPLQHINQVIRRSYSWPTLPWIGIDVQRICYRCILWCWSAITFGGSWGVLLLGSFRAWFRPRDNSGVHPSLCEWCAHSTDTSEIALVQLHIAKYLYYSDSESTKLDLSWMYVGHAVRSGQSVCFIYLYPLILTYLWICRLDCVSY